MQNGTPRRVSQPEVDAARTYRRCVQGPAGLVALALVGLWVAYLVPQHLRHRQQLLDSRVDDRFSPASRVVAVTAAPAPHGTGAARRVVRPAQHRPGRPLTVDCGRTTSSATGLLTPGRGQQALTGPPPRAVPQASATGGSTVDRPHATAERISADASRALAQLQAGHAAAVARRGAAARRRGLLAAVLGIATIVGWAAVAIAPAVSWAVGVLPSALLVGVVVLGRRAVVAGQAHDEEWTRRLADARRAAVEARTGATRVVRQHTGPSRPLAGDETGLVPAVAEGVVGRAVHPSDTSTQAFDVLVADGGEEGSVPRHASSGEVPVVSAAPGAQARDGGADDAAGRADDGWQPVPVPPPTYTMKSAAPRREPAPLSDQTPVAAPAVAATDEAPVRTTGSIDLDAVLARRRASGL